MPSDAGRLAADGLSIRSSSPPPSIDVTLFEEAPCTSTTVLHGVSMLIASLILGLAVRDAGLCSLCLNPFFAMLTIAYHTVVLALIYINSKDASCQSPSSFQDVLSQENRDFHPLIRPVVACLLSLAWLGAFIAMAIVLATKSPFLPMPAIFFEDTMFKGIILARHGQKTVLEFHTMQLPIPQTTRAGQRVQIIASAVVCVLLGDIAIRGFLERARECRERGCAFV